MKNKKGVSPVVSTVLLIMIVVILAIIILLFSRSFIKEVILKEIGGKEKRALKFCDEIDIDPIVDDTTGNFGFYNSGVVPINSVNLKLSSAGSSWIEEIGVERGGMVNPGFSTILKDDAGQPYNHNDYDSIEIIPVILGEAESGGIQTVECPEKGDFYSLK